MAAGKVVGKAFVWCTNSMHTLIRVLTNLFENVLYKNIYIMK